MKCTSKLCLQINYAKFNITNIPFKGFIELKTVQAVPATADFNGWNPIELLFGGSSDDIPAENIDNSSNGGNVEAVPSDDNESSESESPIHFAMDSNGQIMMPMPMPWTNAFSDDVSKIFTNVQQDDDTRRARKVRREERRQRHRDERNYRRQHHEGDFYDEHIRAFPAPIDVDAEPTVETQIQAPPTAAHDDSSANAQTLAILKSMLSSFGQGNQNEPSADVQTEQSADGNPSEEQETSVVIVFPSNDESSETANSGEAPADKSDATNPKVSNEPKPVEEIAVVAKPMQETPVAQPQAAIQPVVPVPAELQNSKAAQIAVEPPKTVMPSAIQPIELQNIVPAGVPAPAPQPGSLTSVTAPQQIQQAPMLLQKGPASQQQPILVPIQFVATPQHEANGPVPAMVPVGPVQFLHTITNMPVAQNTAPTLHSVPLSISNTPVAVKTV